MSTLVQIESAVACLPQDEQWTLLEWLQKRLRGASDAQRDESETLKAFRRLQKEVALTSEGAVAWKDSIKDARR